MNGRPESGDGRIERLRAEAADLHGRIDRLEGDRSPSGDRCGCPDCLHGSNQSDGPWTIHPLAATVINCLSIATIMSAVAAFY